MANLEGKVAMKDVSAVKKALGSFITKKEVEKVMLEVYDGYMQSRNDMDKPDTRYSPRPDSPVDDSEKRKKSHKHKHSKHSRKDKKREYHSKSSDSDDDRHKKSRRSRH